MEGKAGCTSSGKVSSVCLTPNGVASRQARRKRSHCARPWTLLHQGNHPSAFGGVQRGMQHVSKEPFQLLG